MILSSSRLKTVLVLTGVAWCAACFGAETSCRPRPVVGAIRWDAWTGGGVTEQVERTLGPQRYHDRLPWFAEIIAKDRVRIDGSPAEVMDREIGFAADAGLDYWAFLVYPESSTMSVALGQYLRSARRNRIRFCLILHNTLKVVPEAWPRERDRIIALMQQPGYQTVLDGRPLVYAFTGQGFPFDRFAELRTAATKVGLKPYWVYMGWSPARDYKRMSPMGFDAVSAYAKGGQQAAFEGLAKATELEYWQAAAKSKVPYVPLVTTGWDKRPRQDHPVSWEKGHAYHQQTVFPSQATPRQIAEHLAHGLEFIEMNLDICAAHALIIYAWNEYDEGGWIAPTRGSDGRPDTSRLDALRKQLR